MGGYSATLASWRTSDHDQPSSICWPALPELWVDRPTSCHIAQRFHIVVNSRGLAAEDPPKTGPLSHPRSVQMVLQSGLGTPDRKPGHCMDEQNYGIWPVTSNMQPANLQ